MKTLITNPPWITSDRIGFRSNVRWPFTVTRKDWNAKGRPSYHFPLYQAYAAALLRANGLEVGAIDCSVDAMDNAAYLRAVQKGDADIIVIEVATASFAGDIDVARQIKEMFGAPVVLIGPHATIFHEQIIGLYGFVDYVARGEYEYTLLELVQALSAGESPRSVRGVTWRLDGGVAVNPSRPFIEHLDDLPFPARDLYQWERYYEPTHLALPWITLISSRGCPYRCIFCSWPQTMYGHAYRTRSARNVADEIELCEKKYRPGEYFFDDDTFALSKRHVMGICDEICERGMEILWSCMGRVDTVDREMLEAMYRAGCRKIKFGVETGSPAIMETIRKGIDLDVVEGKFRLAKECGLEVHGTFMIGLPGETRETVYETIKLARKLPNDSLQFSIATPFHGTEFFRMCEENGWLVTTDWADLDGNFGAVMSYPQMPKDEIEEMLYFALAACQAPLMKEAKTITGKFLREARMRGLGPALAHTAKYLLKKVGLSRPAQPELRVGGPLRLGVGWYTADNPLGFAGMGKEALCRIEGEGPGERMLLRLTSRAPCGEPPFPLIEVYAGGARVAALRQGPEWETHEVALPSIPMPAEVRLRVDRTLKVPQQQKLPKFFGLLVKEISVETA